MVLAVGNLPCELSRDASEAFSHTSRPSCRRSWPRTSTAPFDELALPGELKRALILHHGELTPDYDYLRSFL